MAYRALQPVTFFVRLMAAVCHDEAQAGMDMAGNYLQTYRFFAEWQNNSDVFCTFAVKLFGQSLPAALIHTRYMTMWKNASLGDKQHVGKAG